MAVEVVGVVETAVHMMHAPIEPIAGAVGRGLVIGLGELRRVGA